MGMARGPQWHRGLTARFAVFEVATGEPRPVLPACPEPVITALMLQSGLGVLCGGDDWLVQGGTPAVRAP